MLDADTLLERAELYLKTLVAGTVASLSVDFDSATPFGELGIDSFRVLKIIKSLEADFGTLPKTLLFEHFNVASLARYFVDKHRDALVASLSSSAVTIPAVAAPVQEKTLPAPARGVARATPVRLLEKDLPQHPELQACVEKLLAEYRSEGCVSRGTRNIAPNLFIGSERRGFFHYGRGKNIILVYAYTGPTDYFQAIAAEMLEYCAAKKIQLNIFADELIQSIASVPFSATPFGVLQRILNLPEFTIEGGAMRRLRYQVAKFQKAGACTTQEYRCGTDPQIDRNIAGVIDQWCASKPMVNPLIHSVKAEILAGRLHPQHRLFLTRVDDVLVNVILISELCPALNGYLMDLEFYTPTMPLGGLEFAIVEIIRALVAEGRTMLSMGGTYGCRLTASDSADPAIDRILDDLHKQQIFNDEGNLQFKNKFRPENRTVYLCREAGSGNADNVIDIIMMIADPAQAQTSDEENHNAARSVPSQTTAPASKAAVVPGNVHTDRARALEECGFNPFNLAAEQVEIDLKTDSWAQLQNAVIDKQMVQLRSQLQQPVNVSETLQGIFPFKHIVLADAGRTAEHLLCEAWPRRGVVPQNLLFPSGIYNQIDSGFTPRELPHPGVYRVNADEPYKGNLCLEKLREELAQRAAEIAFVCIEVSDNASGGCPVSLQHLREVRQLLSPHSIPLILDATRVLENAQHLIDHESEHAGKSPWVVAREILACADVIVASLAKDFCIDKGGLIATNDDGLMHRIEELMQRQGGGLDVIDRKLIAASLQHRERIETLILRRMQAVRSVWEALRACNVPVVRPAGAHCVLIDVKRIEQFNRLPHPVASFLAWMYLSTGIRAGAHSVGMQKNTALNDLVRLAIPVGMPSAQVREIADRLTTAFTNMTDIPELALEGAATGTFVDPHARYTALKYHEPSVPAAVPTAIAAAPVQTLVSVSTLPTARQPIAIVGMAGRYPKAKNLAEFWDNLREGRDCVGEMPQERLARRMQHAFTRGYRGGFLEDIDRFDSLFFNISPREAEVLDPQERLFLEIAWEALEDAGYYPEILAADNAPREVGVFVGAVWAMYQIVGLEQKLAGNAVNPNSFLWSIANRVSYWMNLCGPSLTIDTACSSSLTALHLACEAIHNGDCSSALVGGVNLDLHQTKFDINWSGGALSIDGVCRSFGGGANGYVAGEGVGALFLKPLDAALADSDQIYGVIRASVVNHGGRTSGYTVPNPKAHAALISAALQRAGIDARSLGYIEAHGTGTELGDPIEISGLTSAFETFQVGRQTCAIGSVKTNIGHLEAAAGIVGVCKTLLQMKHGQLVPSLHSGQLNEHIDFASTPFYVQQQLQEWRCKEIDGVRTPLRAGISSFGAGGANAHVVIEHYEMPGVEATSPSVASIFPLSARNEEQLREMAQRLRDYLRREDAPSSLNDIAFTLQNGRKSFDHRVAIVATTRQEIIDRLGQFLAGDKGPDVVSGHAKSADNITKLLSRKEKEQFISLLLQSRDARKMAQLWVDGLLADCRGMAQQPGRRVSLPTYPFADKRHWIATSTTLAGHGVALQTRPGMHPLIDSNESTFERQLFKKSFRATDFFLRDHVVSDVPTLPGVAYLDLARKAGEIAAGRTVRKIRNVTWVSPLTVTGSAATEAFIELKPSADAVNFEVFSDGADGKKKLHAQGKLLYATKRDAAPAEYLDLAAIRARCTNVIFAEAAYPRFRSVGLNYGPSFQVLRQVFSGGTEFLGELQLPEVREGDFAEFSLHPSILDASMQAGVVGQLGEANGEMKVPYSIGEVELLHPLTRRCYSYVSRAQGERASGSAMSRENVTIVDETGKVLAKLRECVGVPLVAVHEKPTTQMASDPSVATLYYSHVWEPAELQRAERGSERVLLFAKDEQLRASKVDVALVMPGEKFEDLGNRTYRINPQDRADYTRVFESLARSQWPIDRICYAWSDKDVPDGEAALTSALERGVYSFLMLCQALIEQRITGTVQLLYVYFGSEDLPQPHNEAMHGFARALHLEHPKIHCKVMELRQQQSDLTGALECMLAELRPDAWDTVTILYKEGVRYSRRLRRLELPALEGTRSEQVPLKQRGAYLITGGAGGLGLIFAKFLARECKARLTLTGRSALCADIQTKLDALRAAGAEVCYIAADISRAEDVGRVLRESKDRFGEIDGIVHSAGVLRDSYLRKKTRDEMQAVFAPKIFGTTHLDELTRAEDLDFFVTFSSLAAVGGNAGQCDYAFANHFMDSFAARREALRHAGQRSGKTISLNWSLWADGGMKLDAQTEQFFWKNLGIRPLRKEVGLEGFLQGLLADGAQLAVLEGVRSKIERAWGLTREEAPVGATAPIVTSDGADLSAQVTQELSKMVLELLKLNAADLSLDAILVDLGFDSIGLATFANTINEKYQLEINPVLFFEHPNIRAVAGVLVAEHGDAVRRVHQTQAPAARSAPAAVQADVTDAPIVFNKGALLDRSEPNAADGDGFSRELRFIKEPIAIVGIAGTMPQSSNLEEFWDNLRNSRDLVTEIPRDRWIWEEHDGNPVKEANKSNSRWGGFMKEVDKFDTFFFGITPREAEMMDPQQRIFLETVWHAIEDSGHKVSDLAGTRTGLFVGVSAKDYIDVLTEHQMAVDGYSASGNSHSILANRISFLLNLRGPSAPLDTACSSSLIALHRAIESIHTGSSDMAIVGGVQVMLTPVGHISLSSAGMLSVDGKCKTFDKNANGYVRGEGSGAIFIKKLSQAEADGDPIYAVIKATAENHGGRVTLLTAPNPNAQAELLIEAYGKAQIDPTTVGYIECHGTGTSLGDPIEIQALKKAFGDLYKKNGKAAPSAPHCGLSSVKTNIGHLEPAAGIAGLLKVLLAMRNKEIPALLHFNELNPYIDLKGSPFYIVDQTRRWDQMPGADGLPLPRRAGVSSFGWGGANAHVVLEEYLPREREAIVADKHLIVLSAKNEDRLRAYAESLLAHIRKREVLLEDLAFTLQTGRDELEERLAVVVGSVGDLSDKLQAWLDGKDVGDLHRGRVARSKSTGEEITSEDLPTLAAAWIKGSIVDWNKLHAGRSRRLNLPGYPFARERYWIDTTANKTKARPTASVSMLPTAHIGSLMATPKWEPLTSDAPSKSARYARHEMILCNLTRVDVAKLQALVPGAAVSRVPLLDEHSSAERYHTAALGCFERVQGILRSRPNEPVLFQLVVGHEKDDTLLAGLAGLVRSARLENLQLVAQVVLTSATIDERGLALQLAASRAKPAEVLIKFAGHAPSVLRWQIEEYSGSETIAWRDRGVYLITGGLGGLGMLFARDILKQSSDARIVFTGRSHLTADKQQALEHLSAQLKVSRDQLVYRPLDVNRLSDVEALVAGIVKDFGSLNGVIHSAGMSRDALIVNKTSEEFREVLAPKVNGTVNLDVATRALDLDFLALFSSLSAVTGNAGQADYAAANGFMDQFATHRNQLVNAGLRRGRTLSINWPLWEEGGMQLDPKARALLTKVSGLHLMRTQTGLRAFHRSLQLSASQAVVMEGEAERLATLLLQGRPELGRSQMRVVSTKPTADQLRALVLSDLRRFQAGSH